MDGARVANAASALGVRTLVFCFVLLLKGLLDCHYSRLKLSPRPSTMHLVVAVMLAPVLIQMVEIDACMQQVPLEAIARHVDTISMCLSKGLGAPVGSVIAGDAAFIKKVGEQLHRIWIESSAHPCICLLLLTGASPPKGIRWWHAASWGDRGPWPGCAQ